MSSALPNLTEFSRERPGGWFLHGQCRLNFVSASAVRLDRYQGSLLWVDDLPREIPPAGVTLTNAGLSPDTTYYVYAVMDGATMLLQASTTGHVTAPGFGVEVKADNPRQTLVGMVRTGTAGNAPFADSGAQRLVLSWFNLIEKQGAAILTTSRTTSVNYPSAPVEIHSEIRVEFLTWASRAVTQVLTGTVWADVGGGGATAFCSVDGTVGSNVSWNSSHASDKGGLTVIDFRDDLAEGYHYATLFGSAVGGGITATFAGLAGVIGTFRNIVRVSG